MLLLVNSYQLVLQIANGGLSVAIRLLHRELQGLIFCVCVCFLIGIYQHLTLARMQGVSDCE